MKEKLTAIITIGFIFSLFFYYKVVNPTPMNSSLSENVNTESVVELSQDVIENKDNKLEITDSVSSQLDINGVNDNNCNLNINQTDELEFSYVFKYYRNCNGVTGSFTWNDNIYSTLFKSELNNKVLLVNEQDNKNDNKIIDTTHLQLQNQLIGDSHTK